jgi:hypothetical protein
MAEEKEMKDQEVEIESQEKDIELEIEDDTPEQDRGRQPLPQEMVKELEEDELEDYSEKVKTRLKQMKKVWHDERREKERALREQQEAVALAQKLVEENQKLKGRLTEGEKSLISTATGAAELELEMAKRAYKEAYDSADTDKMVEAQEKLNNASYRLQSLKGYKPPLQQENNSVQNQQAQVQQPQQPRLDGRTEEWRRQNTWFGQDEEMTAAALGLHQKLEKQHGANYIGTDEYWNTVDKTMKRRFPDYFGDDDEAVEAKPQRTEKPATVVAPASRSTAPKKVVLKQSQLAIAKKLGLTPEQYAKEYAKTMGA